MNKQSFILSLFSLSLLVAGSSQADAHAFSFFRAQQHRWFESKLNAAIESGEIKAFIAAYSSERYADFLNTSLSNGESPLIYALKKGAYELAHALIEMSADVTITDAIGRTPLHVCHNSMVAQALIAKGASVTAIDRTGNTPLHTIQPGQATLQLIELFVSNGANVNALNKFKRSPLHQAVEKKWGLEAVDLLLKHKANALAVDTWGNKPSDLAYPRDTEIKRSLQIAMAQNRIQPPAFSSEKAPKAQKTKNNRWFAYAFLLFSYDETMDPVGVLQLT